MLYVIKKARKSWNRGFHIGLKDVKFRIYAKHSVKITETRNTETSYCNANI